MAAGNYKLQKKIATEEGGGAYVVEVDGWISNSGVSGEEGPGMLQACSLLVVLTRLSSTDG